MRSNYPNQLTWFTKAVLALCLIVTTLTCLFSCHKDNDNRKREQLNQKWNLIKRYDTTDSASAGITYSEYTGQAGDYLDFGKDDSLTISMYNGSSKIRIQYTYNESNQTIKVQGGTIYKILELTDTTMDIHGSITINDNDYINRYILKR